MVFKYGCFIIISFSLITNKLLRKENYDSITMAVPIIEHFKAKCEMLQRFVVIDTKVGLYIIRIIAFQVWQNL